MLPRLKRIFGIAVLALVGASVLAYGGDYGIFRVRAAIGGNPYGTVTVRHYYAILQKNGKTQFLFDLPQPTTCIQALFPHSGFNPCWYLSRHTEQRMDI